MIGNLACRDWEHRMKIAVIGLGYVGLPLAVEFGKNGPTVGFDLSERKIAAYRDGVDPTGEVLPARRCRRATQPDVPQPIRPRCATATSSSSPCRPRWTTPTSPTCAC